MNKITKILYLFLLVAVAGGLYAQSNLNQISDTAMAPEMVYRVLRSEMRAINNYTKESASLASATTNITWTGTPSYVINGVHVGAITASNTALTGNAIPKGYYCRYLVMVDATGAFSVLQGRAYNADLGDAAYPPAPANKAVFGGVAIYASAGTFTPGTTSLTAYVAAGSGTVTLYNLRNRPVTFTNLQPQ